MCGWASPIVATASPNLVVGSITRSNSSSRVQCARSVRDSPGSPCATRLAFWVARQFRHSTVPRGRNAIPYPPKEVCTNASVGRLAHTDYGGNAGVGTRIGTPFYGQDSEAFNWPDWDRDGLTFLRSEVGFRHISDGTSSTMYVGEKYLNPDNYTTSLDGADNNSMFAGHDWDILRWTCGWGAQC